MVHQENQFSHLLQGHWWLLLSVWFVDCELDTVLHCTVDLGGAVDTNP